MILRKPYAFLIKYFRLIHLILVLPMCYLLYRTNVILNFFQEYLSSEQIITGRDFTGELFNYWMFFLPFIIIIILGILLGVMFYKKKPKIYYMYNILVMISLLVFYNIGYDMIGTLEVQTLATRTLHLIRDLFIIVILLQGVGLVITFIRATGFDIKKFDFGRDLQQLDITEEDAEEFEVDVDIETNVVKRELRKNIRYARYIYIENKFIINGLFLIVFSVACFIIYINLTIYNKTYQQGETFSASGFAISINNSYLTNQNYKGDIISDNYLLVVEMNIKANYENITFNTTKATLKINNKIYYPNNKYISSLIDLGDAYNSSIIKHNEFEKKLLVYEIPSSEIDEKMTFKYLDGVENAHNKMNPKYIKIKLNPYNLDSINENKIVSINDNVNLNETILNNTNINLTGFEIQERFKVNYKYCNKNNCYESYEYLNPVLNTNYDKVLLRVNGQAVIDENLENKNIYDLYTIISYFGKIEYQVGRQTKYYNQLNIIKPKKANVQNTYYIEIPREVIDSKQVSLIIDIRDKSYEYVIQ